MTSSDGNGRKGYVDPKIARELRRVAKQRRKAEQELKDAVLRGVAEGNSIAGMARVLDPAGGISRKLLWQWIQIWTEEE